MGLPSSKSMPLARVLSYSAVGGREPPACASVREDTRTSQPPKRGRTNELDGAKVLRYAVASASRADRGDSALTRRGGNWGLRRSTDCVELGSQ